MAKKNKAKRGVGRPRARNTGGNVAAREAILLAAAELFGDRGFAGTTTRDIAEKVGIRQPSLFYHFKRKKDVLHAIVEEAPAPLFKYSAELDNAPGSAAVRFYKWLLFVFEFLMTEPYGIGRLVILPELRTGAFSARVREMDDYFLATYRNLIEQGIAEGDFEGVDAKVSAHIVFGMAESIWSWYQPNKSTPPGETAVHIADFAMRALLISPSRLQSIKKAAEES